MPINYSKIDKNAPLANEILGEIMFQCPTVANNLVDFESDIKANFIFTEVPASAVQMQSYTPGAPTSAGTMSLFDSEVTPAKVMYYFEYVPDNLRFSRFKNTMQKGAWNTLSSEFEKVVIGGEYAKRIALDVEYKFWNGVTSATKTAVAALTAATASTSVSTQEKALIAASQTCDFDGLLSKVIYNNSNLAQTAGVGGRIKVVGSTKDASTIKAEYDKVYLAIPGEVLHSSVTPRIYAPYEDKALINTYNNNVSNFKDAFEVSGTSYSFNGIEIVFVPIPKNVMLVGIPEHFKWCTDLMSDVTYIKSEPIAPNRDDWFLKTVLTVTSHVQNQKFNVLYVG